MFYPRLHENLSGKVAANRINKTILRELVAKFPEKYGESGGTGSVKTKQRGNVTPEDLANDIMSIVKKDKPEWNISEPDIRLAKKPEGLSELYPTVFFTINGQQEKFVLRGEQKTQATGTPTNVKECLVCYFFKSDKKYEPFKKMAKQETKESNYLELLEEVTTDIKRNGIPGCKIKDIKEVTNFLTHESGKYNLDFVNAMFNAMSIGNFLRESKFADWDIDRGDLFDYIKDTAGKDILGYSNVDKWCPMDIMLYEPGSEQAIKDKLNKVKEEQNEDIQAGKINSLFIEDVDAKKDNAVILAISLKEQIAQAGKAKGYIRKLEPKFGNAYYLSKDEIAKHKDTDWLHEKIVQYRKNIKRITDDDLDSFKYEIQNGNIDEYDLNNEPIKKYAALKMVLYILSAAINNKNIFTNIVKYGLSMENNPTFFKLVGNIEGDPDKVKSKIEKYPASSGVQLYDPKDDDFDGKITIIDSNNNRGLYIEYYIEFSGIIYFSRINVRANQSGITSQVTVEIQKWSKYKDLNESFYPRLNLIKEHISFTDESDPIKDMGIGLSDAEFILNAILNVAGDSVIIHEITDYEKRRYRLRGKFIFNREVPLLPALRKEIKSFLGNKRIPNKYISDFYNPYVGPAAGKFKGINYLALFRDIYGGDWYCYDMELYKDNRLIVNLLMSSNDLTFKDFFETVDYRTGNTFRRMK